ncbi:DUF7134 domain-containing protein [Catenuloplanes indicus]|uniref:DUF7134 domain-containing protein n=1 Tax=Catenuloplanes indicus TaxID=137267 RepID=A0AAE3VVA3_9ACTN|nr:hypothetical protein [Catenuloplanes indicus]MDQ0363959.1 hypothetical protein [Catenuloplanes indicus]
MPPRPPVGAGVLLDVSFTVLFWLVFGLSSLMVAGPVGLAVATATIVALAVRRRHPAAVLGWSAAMFAVQLLVVPIPLPANAAQTVVVYTVAARVMSARVRLLALGSAVTGCLAGGTVHAGRDRGGATGKACEQGDPAF